MPSWEEFETNDPTLASFGRERFETARVAYLATVDAAGNPRVHPVTPFVAEGRLYVFMYPTSPKGHDLRRNGRYALHSQVLNEEGEPGEFTISGRAKPVADPDIRAIAVKGAGYDVQDHSVLFELEVERASATRYDEGVERFRWPAQPAAGEPASSA